MFPLPITHLRLSFRALDPVSLPDYAGSTWRGALGQALRRTVCVCPGMECRACMLRDACWYARLYETPVKADCRLLAGYSDAPHPMVPVMTPLGGHCTAGDGLRLELTLFGQAREAVPFLVQAAQRLAAFGLGRGRGKLALDDWSLLEAEDGASGPWQPPEPWTAVRLAFETPLRLRVKNRVLGPGDLQPRPLVTALLRRLSLLACHYGEGNPELDYKALAEQAQGMEVLARELSWFRWSRYSSRQQRHVDMDGVAGWLELGPCPDLWPLLWAGQWLHVGKGASMGMGKYRLEAVAEAGISRSLRSAVACPHRPVIDRRF